jgi:hypothetical protein
VVAVGGAVEPVDGLGGNPQRRVDSVPRLQVLEE